MPVAFIQEDLYFPPVINADPDGLLAIGGDLSPERLLLAYRNGIFPWFSEDEPICWWYPDPRFVLFPEEFKLSKSVKPLLKKNVFRFTTNHAFRDVIHACKNVPRAGQSGTWITDEVEQAYLRLHELGYAHSAEIWQDDQLVGGLYGIRMGQVFFGESMFSLVSNASRYCFARYVELLKQEGTALIDCQVYTPFLESMGARMVPGDYFSNCLREWIPPSSSSGTR